MPKVQFFNTQAEQSDIKKTYLCLKRNTSTLQPKLFDVFLSHQQSINKRLKLRNHFQCKPS